MQCPHQDGELQPHTAQGENGLVVHYSTCASCRGYWMNSFAANFIKIRINGKLPAISVEATYHCPVCAKQLLRTTGENIPDDVFVYDCPRHHGYFFPTGQLAAFKKAQHTKIEYHKIWHVPLPNVGSVLLASITLLILAGGIAVTFRGLMQQQTTRSQANQMLHNHSVFIASNQTTVLITATTAVPAVVSVHIASLNNFVSPMQSQDRHIHQITILNIPPGTYDYFFTMDISGNFTQSDTFTFTIRP